MSIQRMKYHGCQLYQNKWIRERLVRQVDLTAGEVSTEEPEREMENILPDEVLSWVCKFSRASSWGCYTQTQVNN